MSTKILGRLVYVVVLLAALAFSASARQFAYFGTDPSPLSAARCSEKEQAHETNPKQRLIVLDKEITADYLASTRISVALSPDGKWLALKGWAGAHHTGAPKFVHWIALVDATTGKQAFRIRCENGGEPAYFLFSPDSRSLLVTSPGKATGLFDLSAQKFIATFEGSGELAKAKREEKQRAKEFVGPIEGSGQASMHFSPDNSLVVGFSGDKFIGWDLPTGKQVYQQKNPFGPTTTFTFSEDGRYVAARHCVLLNRSAPKTELAQWRALVQLWQVADGKAAGQLGSAVDWNVLSSPAPELEQVQLQAGVLNSGFRLRKMTEDIIVAFPALSPSLLPVTVEDARSFGTIDELKPYQGELSQAHPSTDLLAKLRTAKELVLVGREIVEYDPDSDHNQAPVLVILRRSVTSAKEKAPPAVDLEKWFDQLATGDAPRAHEAALRLIRYPDEAVALFKKRVRPAPAPDPELVARLIGRLDDDDFDVREKAEGDLLARIEQALPALRKAIGGNPSTEARQRLQRIVKALTPGNNPPGPMMQGLWAIEVLEHLGTPEAIDLLRALSKGNADACQTKEAKLSLERLTKR